MFFAATAFAFQPGPETDDHTVTGTFGSFFEEPRVKVADPPAMIGFSLDPVGDLVGRALYTAPLPMSRDEVLRHFAGLRAGADGQAWLAGGPVTVMLDGVSIDETGSMLPARRATPRMESPRSILHRMQ